MTGMQMDGLAWIVILGLAVLALLASAGLGALFGKVIASFMQKRRRL